MAKATSPSRIGYSIERLARELDFSPSFWRREIREGRLAALHIGRRVVVLRADLEAYLKRHAAAADSIS